MVSIKESSLTIDWGWVRSEIARTELGTNASQTCDLAAIAERMMELARTLVMPRAVSRTCPIISTGPENITLDGPVSLPGRTIASFLAEAEALEAFLVTVGEGPEQAASDLMHRGDQVEGYLLDRIASCAVESLAEGAERSLITHYASRAKTVSFRISPGYCDWPVDEQRSLDRLLDFSRAGVHLTESCMMAPKKSISAIVGIGPAGLYTADKKGRSPCGTCPQKNCSFRRKV